jgi:hypothetical protein
MARACFMSTASGFSIITGMWRGAHASTTLACEKVSVKVATASGFTASSILSRSVIELIGGDVVRFGVLRQQLRRRDPKVRR